MYSMNGTLIDSNSDVIINRFNNYDVKEHFINNNDNKCLKFCGSSNKLLCYKPFIHSHTEITNSKTINTIYEPSCGHCVTNPNIYYVDKQIYNLISNKKY